MIRPASRAAVARRTLVVLPLLASPAFAQSGHLSVDAGASHALPPAGAPGEETSYVLAGLRVEPALPQRFSLFASAHGAIALQEEAGDWGSAALGLAASVPLGAETRFGVSAIGEGFTVGGELPYRAVLARLLPEVRRAFGVTTLRLHGAAGAGRSRVGGGMETEAVETNLWTLGGGVEVRHAAGPLDLTAGVEGFRAARDAGYLSGYVGGAAAVAGVVWSVELRGWDTPGGGEAVAIARLAIPLGRDLEANLAGGRYGPDPLIESPAGVSVSGLLGWRALRFSAGPPPLYRLDRTSGEVRFELEAAGAREVKVVGDFSAWRPLAMLEEAPGRWRLSVRVAPGVYRFGFLVDGEWSVPEAASGRVEDEWGRRNAVLVVPGP